jgi:hypothetical protein
MNRRVVLSSGIMTALVGIVMSIALVHIAGRELRKPLVVGGGAALGFVLGSSFSMIMQQKQERSDEYNDQSDL